MAALPRGWEEAWSSVSFRQECVNGLGATQYRLRPF